MLCCDWDMVEAHYTFCMDYHAGQWSPEYARMCRLGRFFKPGPMWQGYESMSEDAQAIYDSLVLAITGN